MSAPEPPALDGLLVETACALFASGGVDPSGPLRSVVDAAVRTIPGADEVGVSVLDGRGTLSTPVASAPVVAEVDRVQSELGEGPVLDSLAAGDVPPCTLVPDLGAQHPPGEVIEAVRRWGRWVTRARAAGFAGVLCYPLTGPGFAGALTVLARTPHALGSDSVLVGGLFADQAADVLHGARRVTDVGRALAGRDVLGRAKGIVAERFGLTDADAFTLLAESARSTGVGLSEMVRRVVEESDSRATPFARRRGPGRPVTSTPRPA